MTSTFAKRLLAALAATAIGTTVTACGVVVIPQVAAVAEEILMERSKLASFTL